MGDLNELNMEWKYVDVLMVIMRIDILLRVPLATAKLLRIMSRSHDLDIETIELLVSRVIIEILKTLQ